MQPSLRTRIMNPWSISSRLRSTHGMPLRSSLQNNLTLNTIQSLYYCIQRFYRDFYMYIKKCCIHLFGHMQHSYYFTYMELGLLTLLYNTLCGHSSFWGVRRFTGVLRSFVYHVYRVIVGEFRLTPIWERTWIIKTIIEEHRINYTLVSNSLSSIFHSLKIYF